MTIQELQALIAAADAAIAKAEGEATVTQEAISITDLPTIINIGIIVLKAIDALLWWKPTWQAAISNIILFLETFEPPAPTPTPTPAPTETE